MIAQNLKISDVLELERRLKHDLAAVQHVKELLSLRREVLREREPDRLLNTIEDRVMQLAAQLPGPFGLDDVIRELARLYPASSFKRTTISSILYRLKADGKLKVIQEGSGQRAAIYEKL